MKLIAIDPGKTCGYVIADVNKENKIHFLKFGHTSPFECIKEIDVHYNDCRLDAVIIEDFVTSKIVNKSFLETVEIIGAMKHVAEEGGIKIIFQNPSIKRFYSDKRLKKLGFYRKNKHERDAVRHLLYYLKFKKEK